MLDRFPLSPFSVIITSFDKSFFAILCVSFLAVIERFLIEVQLIILYIYLESVCFQPLPPQTVLVGTIQMFLDAQKVEFIAWRIEDLCNRFLRAPENVTPYGPFARFTREFQHGTVLGMPCLDQSRFLSVVKVKSVDESDVCEAALSDLRAPF